MTHRKHYGALVLSLLLSGCAETECERILRVTDRVNGVKAECAADPHCMMSARELKAVNVWNVKANECRASRKKLEEY